MHSRTSSGKDRGAAGRASSSDAKAKSAWCGPGAPSQAGLRAALARKATNRVHRASSSVGEHFATAGEVRAGQGKAVA